jgi:hypothetical protein
VEQSTETVAPLDGGRVARCPLGEWSEVSGLPKGAVWPVHILGVTDPGLRTELINQRHAAAVLARGRLDRVVVLDGIITGEIRQEAVVSR